MGKAVRLTMLICLALVLASCNIAPTTNVVGKWKAANGNGTIEFTRTGMLDFTQGRTTSNLPYRFTSPTRLEVYLGPLGTVEWDAKVEKDTMILTTEKGKEIKLTKVQEPAQKPGVTQKEQPSATQQGQIHQAKPQQHPAQTQQTPAQQAQPQSQAKQPQKNQHQAPHGQQQHQ